MWEQMVVNWRLIAASLFELPDQVPISLMEIEQYRFSFDEPGYLRCVSATYAVECTDTAENRNLFHLNLENGYIYFAPSDSYAGTRSALETGTLRVEQGKSWRSLQMLTYCYL
jgi:hypothetical protein